MSIQRVDALILIPFAKEVSRFKSFILHLGPQSSARNVLMVVALELPTGRLVLDRDTLECVGQVIVGGGVVGLFFR
jgi:hypothetical protein